MRKLSVKEITEQVTPEEVVRLVISHIDIEEFLTAAHGLPLEIVWPALVAVGIAAERAEREANTEATTPEVDEWKIPS